MADLIPDGRRLALKKALTAQLQTITPANGYRHDLSGADGLTRVMRGRTTFSRESMNLPLVLINENVPKGSDFVWNAQDEGLVIADLPLLILGYADGDADPDNPTDAADLLFDDVMCCLGSEKWALARRQYLNIRGIANVDGALKVIHPPGNDDSGLPYFAIEWRVRMAETFYGPPASRKS